MSLGAFNFSKLQVETNKQTKQKEQISFSDYYKQTIPNSWSIPAHIKLICATLDEFYNSKTNNKLIITMPPRHSKSETTTIRFGAYYLENNPEDNILITSYNERQARRFSRKTRTVFTSRNEILKSKTATDEWSTLEGGVLLARGVGSPITGTGAKLIIIDDPIKSREEAESPLQREKLWDWYASDVLSRLEPDGKIIIVQTRWHEDDLVGKVLELEPNKWQVLKLPALAEENDPLGRDFGEALWPERYSADTLLDLKKVVGDYQFESIYQCNPTPREGSMFKISNLEIIDTKPNSIIKEIRSWDLASTQNDGDYTVGLKLGLDKENNVFILDVVRGQWGVDERDKIIRRTAELDGRITTTLPQDPGSAGKAQLLYLFKLLSGFNVKSVVPTGSKSIRAEPIAAQINVGNVKVLKAPWNRDFIEELRSFPLGRHDDQIDALSDAFNQITKAKKWQAI